MTPKLENPKIRAKKHEVCNGPKETNLATTQITNSLFLFPFDIYFMCGNVISLFNDLITFFQILLHFFF